MFVRKKRAAPARRSKAKKSRSKLPGLHLPQGIEQRHLDLIGIFLIAAGIFLTFVLFYGWEGERSASGSKPGSLICSARSGPVSPSS